MSCLISIVAPLSVRGQELDFDREIPEVEIPEVIVAPLKRRQPKVTQPKAVAPEVGRPAPDEPELVPPAPAPPVPVSPVPVPAVPVEPVPNKAVPNKAVPIQPVVVPPVEVPPGSVPPEMIQYEMIESELIESELIQNELIQPETFETEMVPPEVARWWEDFLERPILDSANWVSFDVQSLVVDALAHNPRIAAVSHQAASVYERIVQEDAVFDPAILLESKYASTNDPVGNTLTTGGPPRLVQDSWNNKAGVVRTTRNGTRVDLSQNMGILDSNSLFFDPNNQGNSQLNLSITKPLRAGSGQFYNERLILRARIDSKVSLQQMRVEVQEQIASTMIVYWRLYQARCDMIQSHALLERGLEISQLVEARRGFDVGELEISKVNTRIAQRRVALIDKELELKNLQTQLVALVSSDSLRSDSGAELIPRGVPSIVDVPLDAEDLLINAMNNRPEVRSAALNMESASLEISISRKELLPKLNAVVGGYVAGLNGRNDVTRSFGDQFSEGRPGINAGLEYEVPYGRRASRSRHREAHQRFLEMSERYREAVALTTSEVEISARRIESAIAAIKAKKQVLAEAMNQEFLVRSRWEAIGPDGRHAGLVLDDMLDQQENRSVAEQDLVAAEVDFLLAMIELQKATGTLLKTEAIAASESIVE